MMLFYSNKHRTSDASNGCESDNKGMSKLKRFSQSMLLCLLCYLLVKKAHLSTVSNRFINIQRHRTHDMYSWRPKYKPKTTLHQLSNTLFCSKLFFHRHSCRRMYDCAFAFRICIVNFSQNSQRASENSFQSVLCKSIKNFKLPSIQTKCIFFERDKRVYEIIKCQFNQWKQREKKTMS